jgi:hypothetical protein
LPSPPFGALANLALRIEYRIGERDLNLFRRGEKIDREWRTWLKL